MVRIACLAWGSLVWDAGESPLPLSTEWREDGLELPVEFARISKSRNGALTLVLFPGVAPSKTLWAEMKDTISDAIEALRSREQTTARNIGYWQKTGECKSPIHVITSDISKWALERNLDAVIWTDLSSNFEKCQNKTFTPENALEYLRTLKSLNSEGFLKAEEYFRKAPIQIDTAVRRLIQKELGWS